MAILIKDGVNNIDVFSVDANRAPIDPTSITASVISKNGGAWTDTTNTPALTTQGDAPSNPRKYAMNLTASECDTGGTLTHLVFYGAGGAEVWRETHTVLDVIDTAAMETIINGRIENYRLHELMHTALASAPAVASLFGDLSEDNAGTQRFTTDSLVNAPGGGTSNLTTGDVEGIRSRLALDGTKTVPSSTGGTLLGLETLLLEVQGLTFDEVTDSLEAIRNQGDSSWAANNPVINAAFDFSVDMVNINGGGVSGTPTIKVQIDNAAAPYPDFQGTISPKTDGLSVCTAAAADMNGNMITFICSLNGAITRKYTYYTRAA